MSKELHSDLEPGSYLGRRRRFEPIAIVGLIFTALLHGGAIVGTVIYKRNQAEARNKNPAPARQYVVAKLVRWGKKRDKNKLPDKIVPRLATIKKRGVSYDADPNKKPVKRKRRNNRDKVSDQRRSSFDKAAAFAKIQPDKVPDGDPNGVKGGKARRGSKGDMYMTRVADKWNRTWSLPSVIPRAQAKKLYVLVVIRIDRSGNIKFPIKFDRKSGNGVFDGSIRSAWRRIRRLPLPKGDRLARVLSRGIPLRLNWRGMR